MSLPGAFSGSHLKTNSTKTAQLFKPAKKSAQKPKQRKSAQVEEEESEEEDSAEEDEDDDDDDDDEDLVHLDEYAQMFVHNREAAESSDKRNKVEEIINTRPELETRYEQYIQKYQAIADAEVAGGTKRTKKQKRSEDVASDSDEESRPTGKVQATQESVKRVVAKKSTSKSTLTTAIKGAGKRALKQTRIQPADLSQLQTDSFAVTEEKKPKKRSSGGTSEIQHKRYDEGVVPYGCDFYKAHAVIPEEPRDKKERGMVRCNYEAKEVCPVVEEEVVDKDGNVTHKQYTIDWEKVRPEHLMTGMHRTNKDDPTILQSELYVWNPKLPGKEPLTIGKKWPTFLTNNPEYRAEMDIKVAELLAMDPIPLNPCFTEICDAMSNLTITQRVRAYLPAAEWTKKVKQHQARMNKQAAAPMEEEGDDEKMDLESSQPVETTADVDVPRQVNKWIREMIRRVKATAIAKGEDPVYVFQTAVNTFLSRIRFQDRDTTIEEMMASMGGFVTASLITMAAMCTKGGCRDLREEGGVNMPDTWNNTTEEVYKNIDNTNDTKLALDYYEEHVCKKEEAEQSQS